MNATNTSPALGDLKLAESDWFQPELSLVLRAGALGKSALHEMRQGTASNQVVFVQGCVSVSF